MQYMLMCCFDETRWEGLSEKQREGIMRDYGALIQSLIKNGHYLNGGKLKSTSAATTIRGGNGKPAITDGPFAETKEQLGGFYAIEAENLDYGLSLSPAVADAAGRVTTRLLREVDCHFGAA